MSISGGEGCQRGHRGKKKKKKVADVGMVIEGHSAVEVEPSSQAKDVDSSPSSGANVLHDLQASSSPF